MGNNCNEIVKIISTWEKEGVLSPNSLAILKAHFKICSRCSKKYVYLFPFIKRDSDFLRKSFNPESCLDTDFSQKVIDKISRITPPKPKKKHSLLLYAAAAVFLLSIGIGYIFRTGNFSRNNQTIVVNFILSAPGARTVSLAGDFNGWDPDKLYFSDPEGDGVWKIKIKLKKDVYLYNFIIDGENWITDPLSQINVSDGFGGENSLLNL